MTMQKTREVDNDDTIKADMGMAATEEDYNPALQQPQNQPETLPGLEDIYGRDKQESFNVIREAIDMTGSAEKWMPKSNLNEQDEYLLRSGLVRIQIAEHTPRRAAMHERMFMVGLTSVARHGQRIEDITRMLGANSGGPPMDGQNQGGMMGRMKRGISRLMPRM